MFTHTHPFNDPTTQFLQAGCPSCRPTNSIKALKALLNVHTVLNQEQWVAAILTAIGHIAAATYRVCLSLLTVCIHGQVDVWH